VLVRSMKVQVKEDWEIPMIDNAMVASALCMRTIVLHCNVGNH
jgi:hypothetical protein